jgi:hypothetical protein
MSHFLDRRQFLMMPVLAGVLRASDALLIKLPAAKPEKHPEPRPGITAENVLTAAAYEADIRSRIKNEKRVGEVLERVKKAFEHAREIPQVLDGLYCYCECHEQGHRSLLTCFEVVQAVGCWSCKEESELAYKLHSEGKTLAEIREAVDKKFG